MMMVNLYACLPAVRGERRVEGEGGREGGRGTLSISLLCIVIGAPISVRSKIIDKTNVELVWSHPDDPLGVLLEYQVIYYGYKQDEANQVKKSLESYIVSQHDY